MINSVVVVGRVVERPIKLKTDSGVNFSYVTLATQRPFKNLEGGYDADFIKCLIWEGLVDTCCEYCTKGSIIGVRGRLQTKVQELEFNGEVKKINSLDVIAEKISFIKLMKEEKVEENKGV